MGTMIGSGRRRKFGKIQYYHWGNSDSMREAYGWQDELEDVAGIRLKVTDDHYGGGDIWVKVKDKSRMSSYEKGYLGRG